MTEDADREWPLNRPVSAHITIHYEDSERERAGKVVKTVLNIDQGVEAGSEDLTGSLGRYSLQEACRSPTASPRSSRRPSNANSVNMHDFYQCVHRQRGPGSDSGTKGSYPAVRRFSEPRVPNEGLHPRHMHTQPADSPFVRSKSCVAGMDPLLAGLAPLTTCEPEQQTSGSPSRKSSSSSSASGSPSEASADHQCLDLSCPCSRHHHRRNSVAVKFHKAMYKKA